MTPLPRTRIFTLLHTPVAASLGTKRTGDFTSPRLRGEVEICAKREFRVRGTLDRPNSRRVPLTRRYAIAEASLRRSFLRTAAEGGLCSPRKRGEVSRTPAPIQREAMLLRTEQGSGHPLDGVTEDRDHLVDVALLDDQGRRHRKGVAAHAQIKPVIEAIDHDVIAARADSFLARRDLDGAHQADITDVDDVGQTLERMQRIAPVVGERCTARQQAFGLVDIERRNTGGA